MSVLPVTAKPKAKPEEPKFAGSKRPYFLMSLFSSKTRTSGLRAAASASSTWAKAKIMSRSPTPPLWAVAPLRQMVLDPRSAGMA